MNRGRGKNVNNSNIYKAVGHILHYKISVILKWKITAVANTFNSFENCNKTMGTDFRQNFLFLDSQILNM